MASIKQVLRQVKNNVFQYADIEVKVREATSNEKWGVKNSELYEIARATNDYQEYPKLFAMLWKRLNDVQVVLHVQKSLILILFLLRNGSERFIRDCKARIRDIAQLKKFRHFDGNSEEDAKDVRAKAKLVYDLLTDDTKLADERAKAERIRKSGAVTGFGNTTNAQNPGGAEDWGDRIDKNRRESADPFQFEATEKKAKKVTRDEVLFEDSDEAPKEEVKEKKKKKKKEVKETPIESEDEGKKVNEEAAPKKKKKSKAKKEEPVFDDDPFGSAASVPSAAAAYAAMASAPPAAPSSGFDAFGSAPSSSLPTKKASKKKSSGATATASVPAGWDDDPFAAHDFQPGRNEGTPARSSSVPPRAVSPPPRAASPPLAPTRSVSPPPRVSAPPANNEIFDLANQFANLDNIQQTKAVPKKPQNGPSMNQLRSNSVFSPYDPFTGNSSATASSSTSGLDEIFGSTAPAPKTSSASSAGSLDSMLGIPTTKSGAVPLGAPVQPLGMNPMMNPFMATPPSAYPPAYYNPYGAAHHSPFTAPMGMPPQSNGMGVLNLSAPPTQPRPSVDPLSAFTPIPGDADGQKKKSVIKGKANPFDGLTF